MGFNLCRGYANCIGEKTYGRNSKNDSANYPGNIRAPLAMRMVGRLLPRILGQPAHELAGRDCLRACQEGPDGWSSGQSSKILHFDSD